MQFHYLKEQTLKEIGYYYTRAMYHDKTADIGTAAARRFNENIAETADEKKISKEFVGLGETIGGTSPSVSNAWGLACRAAPTDYG